MSSLTTLARPYARAAFEMAQAAGDLPGWGEALDAAAAVVANESMADWLNSPDRDRELAIRIIEEATGGTLDLQMQMAHAATRTSGSPSGRRRRRTANFFS